MADSNDLALGYAMGQDSGNNCNNGWGADGGWLWILVIFALLGFGGGGFGGGFGGGLNGALTRADLCSEFNFNGLENAVRGVQSGLCDGFYAVNTSLLNGFHGVDNAICTLGFQTQQGFNATQAQMAQCCCETQRLIERGFCDTNYNIATNTTSIIQNAHNDTDRVIAKLDAMEMSRKDETIAALRSQVDALNLAQSQANQNNYLVNTLRPCPTPAYISCNPWAAQAPYGSCYTQGCGCNSNCGC